MHAGYYLRHGMDSWKYGVFQQSSMSCIKFVLATLYWQTQQLVVQPLQCTINTYKLNL